MINMIEDPLKCVESRHFMGVTQDGILVTLPSIDNGMIYEPERIRYFKYCPACGHELENLFRLKMKGYKS